MRGRVRVHDCVRECVHVLFSERRPSPAWKLAYQCWYTYTHTRCNIQRSHTRTPFPASWTYARMHTTPRRQKQLSRRLVLLRSKKPLGEYLDSARQTPWSAGCVHGATGYSRTLMESGGMQDTVPPTQPTKTKQKPRHKRTQQRFIATGVRTTSIQAALSVAIAGRAK